MKEHLPPCVHCSVVYSSRDLDAAQGPSAESGWESCGAFTRWNTAQLYEKTEILPFVTARMGLESSKLSDISQLVKDEYDMISLITGT